METLPTTAKGVVISETNEMSYGERPLGELGENEVMIKVHSAPINPSDISFTKGQYASPKQKPTFPGFEGAGIVVGAGSSARSQGFLNKRVAFFAKDQSLGTWGEYTIIQNAQAYPIPESLTYEQGACALINPLTVEGFIHYTQKEGHKCIIHSPGASAVGKMLVAACKREGITLINVVRRQEQVDIMTGIGAELVINTGNDNWKQEAKALFAEHKPGAFFDAVAGEPGNAIFDMMAPKTTTYNYGFLSGKNYSIGPKDLIFMGKILTGFWLMHLFEDLEVSKVLFGNAFKYVATGEYSTDISNRFSHEKFSEALDFYKKNMSKGKVLLQNPNFGE